MVNSFTATILIVSLLLLLNAQGLKLNEKIELKNQVYNKNRQRQSLRSNNQIRKELISVNG